ncbi:MAG: phytanoyl-CoA dioxygenase family protein [Betaproteobacteria bacterium]|nr:phytanoyl-CoA dioxygenase family protein [Betaproteobacteria bacterium]
MQDTVTRLVTDADVQAYRDDGAICVRNVLDAAWCKRMLAASVRLMDYPDSETRDKHEPGGGRFYRNLWMAWRDEDFRALRDESPVARVAARLMEASSVRYFYDQLFIKEPGTQTRTNWHQDLPFWPFMGGDIVSIWIALTPVTKATSGVEYVAGSHRWNKYYRTGRPDAKSENINQALEECPDFSEPQPGARMLSWDLQPGDVLCHHPLVVHGAGANPPSAHRRVGLSIRFFGDDAVYDPKPYTVALARVPRIKPGEPPNDDHAFPVVWEAGRGRVNTAAH